LPTLACVYFENGWHGAQPAKTRISHAPQIVSRLFLLSFATSARLNLLKLFASYGYRQAGSRSNPASTCRPSAFSAVPQRCGVRGVITKRTGLENSQGTVADVVALRTRPLTLFKRVHRRLRPISRLTPTGPDDASQIQGECLIKLG
jgi:hypothetical protein